MDVYESINEPPILSFNFQRAGYPYYGYYFKNKLSQRAHPFSSSLVSDSLDVQS